MRHCRWIAGKISEILGNEDDVVIELCFNLLEGSRFVRLLLIFQPKLLTCLPAGCQVLADPAYRLSR